MARDRCRRRGDERLHDTGYDQPHNPSYSQTKGKFTSAPTVYPAMFANTHQPSQETRCRRTSHCIPHVVALTSPAALSSQAMVRPVGGEYRDIRCRHKVRCVLNDDLAVTEFLSPPRLQPLLPGRVSERVPLPPNSPPNAKRRIYQVLSTHAR